MAANTLGAPQLITPGTLMDKPGAMGPKGTLLVVGRSYRSLSWKDADYYLDIKVRLRRNSSKKDVFGVLASEHLCLLFSCFLLTTTTTLFTLINYKKENIYSINNK